MWNSAENPSFQSSKETLQSDLLLVHYNSSNPLILACDASQYGLGAVWFHSFEDGTEHPIACSLDINPSRELPPLAIIFGVKKFHNYIYGSSPSSQTTNPYLICSVNPREPYQWHPLESKGGYSLWAITTTLSLSATKQVLGTMITFQPKPKMRRNFKWTSTDSTSHRWSDTPYLDGKTPLGYTNVNHTNWAFLRALSYADLVSFCHKSNICTPGASRM